MTDSLKQIEIKNGKAYRDGMVGVLYSPGYGAGWSTWSPGDTALFCPELVQFLVEHAEGDARQLSEEKAIEFMALAERLFPDDYCGGVRDLRVEWMTPGTAFRVTEYDGSESIEYSGSTDWSVA